MTNSTNDNYCEISFRGLFEPEAISKILNVVPTKTWRPGERSMGKGPIADVAGWCKRFYAKEDGSLEGSYLEALQLVKEITNKYNALLPKGMKRLFSVVIGDREARPAIYFGVSEMSLIVECGMDFDVDICA